MIKQQRWSIILNLCEEKDEVDVSEFVLALKVSEATVRRDLQQMEDLDMITRYHGGAKINKLRNSEQPMIFKSETNSDSKRKVARLAASLIEDNQMIFIDAGSSTYEMINYITAKNITVVTTGIPHIQSLGLNSIRTIILGGSVRWSTQAITGNQALSQLNNLFFDKAFLGVNGIHQLHGFTTTNEQEAEIKSKIMSQSTDTYFLADHSKFNKLFPVKYADLKDGTILTDTITDFDSSTVLFKIAK